MLMTRNKISRFYIHVHDRSLTCVRTDTSIKSGGAKASLMDPNLRFTRTKFDDLRNQYHHLYRFR